MLNEFVYRGKTYCIKTPLDSDYTENEVVKFNQLQDIRSFFETALNDYGSDAWVIVMGIAKWNYPFSCRPPKRCPEPTEHDYFQTFCQQIYNGELTLIEIKHFKGKAIKDLKLQQCCVDLIKDINSRIVLSNILGGVLVVLPVFKAFFYPPGYSKWASLTSTVYSIGTEDWELLAKDIQIVPMLLRKVVRDEAQRHAYDHDRKHENKLRMFWEGIVDAFNY
ncbi:MAG: hypothetical protein HKP58_20755 [Desulfatitalea sp.]|nr:hypothetical protein [Desulfatitalea sp.]NNK02848.1 hypothetical protein [Desulfatitalea sp.]